MAHSKAKATSLKDLVVVAEGEEIWGALAKEFPLASYDAVRSVRIDREQVLKCVRG